MTKIFITGSKGRMGQNILQCAQQDSEIEVAGLLEKGQSILERLQPGVVIIDFTTPSAIPAFAEAAVEMHCPMVIGTTGFSPEEHEGITHASKIIPIVMASNMSVGINLLSTVVQLVRSVLQEGFDVEIIEKHHRHKKDAPSGTAVSLAEALAEVKGLRLSDLVKHGRSGNVGARTSEEIGIHSVRGGDFVGEHTVIFAGEGELIEITHKSHSRSIFSKGALVAAKWIAKAQPGLYDMRDVLGLRISSSCF